MPNNAYVVRQLSDIDPRAWNALSDGAYPYLRHEFLAALETEGCLGAKVGWMPYHLVLEDDAGTLLAACPAYLKSNSFGEFVFDWMFADAYAQAGLDYYPKLVIAAPFTPTTGPRLLVHPDHRDGPLADDLIARVIDVALGIGTSSAHWLFTVDAALMDSPKLLKRMGYQFHWNNPGVSNFEEYLAGFTSKRRKEIKRERRMVFEAGIVMKRQRGDEVEPPLWDQVYELYCQTFAQYGNYPALSRRFFYTLAATMGENVLLVGGYRDQQLVAMAYFLIGRDCLYGRYWVAVEDVPGLHFEACYYQGVEYCLEAGLHRFEPGAQGEHKISRGFLPTPTWSAHWI
ncbi:MAG: GNAT family N-acetyltransferase, partial [Methylococcaceae bacterium]